MDFAHECTSRNHSPFTNGNDGTAVLCNRDEQNGRNSSKLRIMPAKQGFKANDSACLHIHLRLVLQQEFILVKRVPEMLVYIHSLSQRRVHRPVIDREDAFSCLRRSVHSHVGILKQLFRIFAIFGITGDPDTYSSVYIAGVNPDRLFELADQVSCNREYSFLVLHILDEIDELVTGQAIQHSFQRQQRGQLLTNLTNQLVPGLVSECIINELEVIHINEEYGRLSFRVPEEPVQVLKHIQPVRQSTE
ncbi:hypothetical protein D3C81_1327050 [compost metagenome]